MLITDRFQIEVLAILCKYFEEGSEEMKKLDEELYQVITARIFEAYQEGRRQERKGITRKL